MMYIELSKIGRRYKRTWIFRNISFQFPEGSHSIITGANGSGKSTLIQIISGFLSPTEGSILFRESTQQAVLKSEKIPEFITIAAPYLDLFEDLSLEETIDFHFKFRNAIRNLTREEIIDILDLKPHADKALRYFSSGMRQRVRLGLAILTNSPVLLLDEPTSNLDHNAIAWYKELLTAESENRTVIVSTNQNEDDYIKSDYELKIDDT